VVDDNFKDKGNREYNYLQGFQQHKRCRQRKWYNSFQCLTNFAKIKPNHEKHMYLEENPRHIFNHL